jgi:hypothetical protein
LPHQRIERAGLTQLQTSPKKKERKKNTTHIEIVRVIMMIMITLGMCTKGGGRREG